MGMSYLMCGEFDFGKMKRVLQSEQYHSINEMHLTPLRCSLEKLKW